MNGQLRVRSEPGKGTIFSIELPFEHAPTTPIKPRGTQVNPEAALMPRSLSGTNTPPTPTSHADLPPNLLKERKYSIPDLDPMAPRQDLTLPPIATSFMVKSPDTLPKSHGQMTRNTLTQGSSYPFPETEEFVAHNFSLNILIAEDNPINARLLTKRLQKLGHEVELSCDGQECHDRFTSKSQRVDVILMDIQVCIPHLRLTKYDN